LRNRPNATTTAKKTLKFTGIQSSALSVTAKNTQNHKNYVKFYKQLVHINGTLHELKKNLGETLKIFVLFCSDVSTWSRAADYIGLLNFSCTANHVFLV